MRHSIANIEGLQEALMARYTPHYRTSEVIKGFIAQRTGASRVLVGYSETHFEFIVQWERIRYKSPDLSLADLIRAPSLGEIDTVREHRAMRVPTDLGQLLTAGYDTAHTDTLSRMITVAELIPETSPWQVVNLHTFKGIPVTYDGTEWHQVDALKIHLRRMMLSEPDQSVEIDDLLGRFPSETFKAKLLVLA